MIEGALAELRAGSKHGHWMWFVFPQIAGLGRSAAAQHYAIEDLTEARAYLVDPVLGDRLRECAAALLDLAVGTRIEQVLGEIDAVKLRSCATLFARADQPDGVFAAVLIRFYDGEPDPLTVQLLGLPSDAGR